MNTTFRMIIIIMMLVFISFLRILHQVISVFICGAICKRVVTIVHASAGRERLFFDLLVKITARLRCLDADKSVRHVCQFIIIIAFITV